MLLPTHFFRCPLEAELVLRVYLQNLGRVSCLFVVLSNATEQLLTTITERGKK